MRTKNIKWGMREEYFITKGKKTEKGKEKNVKRMD